jgi:hypothetical protein
MFRRELGGNLIGQYPGHGVAGELCEKAALHTVPRRVEHLVSGKLNRLETPLGVVPGEIDHLAKPRLAKAVAFMPIKGLVQDNPVDEAVLIVTDGK